MTEQSEFRADDPQDAPVAAESAQTPPGGAPASPDATAASPAAPLPAATRDETVLRKMVEELRELVAAGQRRWKALILLEALGLAIAAPLAYLWIVFLLDNIVHLPIWGRLLAAGLLLVVVGLLVRKLLSSWKRAQFTEDQVALAIERRTPGGLQNRLINAIQLSRDTRKAGEPLSQAAVEENYRFLHKVRLEQTAESWPAVVRVTAAAVLIVVGVVFYSVGREQFTRAASRIFMPFSDIEPFYYTRLRVEPGDVKVARGGDIELLAHIEGEMPEGVVLLMDYGSKQGTKPVAIDAEARTATIRLTGLEQSLLYAFRGGDYTSRYYRISVPVPVQLTAVQGELVPPAYTRLPARQVDMRTGDIEALRGSQAALIFTLNQSPAKATLVLTPDVSELAGTPVQGDDDDGSADRIALESLGGGRYTATVTLDRTSRYFIETEQAGEAVQQTLGYTLRATPDASPEVQLSGLRERKAALIEQVLPLEVTAHDDIGLAEAGVFYRKVEHGPRGTTTQGAWQPIAQWTVTDGARALSQTASLIPSALDVIEGDIIEVAMRARDADPAKGDTWTTGQTHRVVISSEGAELQLEYERILRTEAGLAALITAHQKLADEATAWMTQLQPISGMKWDDANVAKLAAAMTAQAAEQDQIRQQASAIAREMSDETGNLKLAVAMLADTEMVRSRRVLEAVMGRETAQARRGALADARLTQQRIIRSLGDLAEQHRLYRQDWELGHMMPFVEMLASRQHRLSEAVGVYATLSPGQVGDAQREAMAAREAKLLELAGLASTATTGLGKLDARLGPILAQAFTTAGAALGAQPLTDGMKQAATAAGEGQWPEAQGLMTQAAGQLDAIAAGLREAKVLAAQQALADLEKMAESNVEAQKAIEQLMAGSGEKLVNAPLDKLDVPDILHLRQTRQNFEDGQDPTKDPKSNDYMFEEAWKDSLAKQRFNPPPPIDELFLAEKPGGWMSFPNSSDREGNEVDAPLRDLLDDLVGELLEEADTLKDDFETYNLNAAWGPSDTGEVGKQGGDMNSTGAMATTGNQKPPPNNVGGVSGTGRQGARAHGMVAGNNSVNRRGRDQVQEGQEEVPDQAGRLHQTKSEDWQEDASVGFGGKVVDDPQTSFNTKDAGEWNDKIADKMQKPIDKFNIIERKGKPMDPAVAAKLRDLESQQEQVIQRIKTIKKELDQLFLPTDHLEDIMARLQANLDRLKETPEKDVFRQQVALLDELKGMVVVFNQPIQGFERSLPRDQSIKGRILDETVRPSVPGYEDAVKQYYKRLSGL